MREAVVLTDAGGDLLFALLWVSRDVSGFDLLAAHVGDVRAVEIPADADDVAIEPVCRIRPAAPCADRPSSQGCLLFCLFCPVLSRWKRFVLQGI